MSQQQSEQTDKLEDSEINTRGRVATQNKATGEDTHEQIIQQVDAEPDVSEKPRLESERDGWDWRALLSATAISVFFALTARFNSQPATSFVPAAVLSASGCGLLVTAVRKLQRIRGVGLLEAALAGLLMALAQFAVAFTYPEVVTLFQTFPVPEKGFFTTWGLIAVFSMLFSLIGAALGHLAFAPLRLLPAPSTTPAETKNEEPDKDEEIDIEIDQDKNAEEEDGEDKVIDDENDENDESEEGDDENDENDTDEINILVAPTRSWGSYAVAVLLLALLPMLAGYVFAAGYDYLMSVEQVTPGIYPTLRLLSGLLPWQLATPVSLVGANGQFYVFTMMWRITSFLANPSLFDVQALEAFTFNAAALALLLIGVERSGETLPRGGLFGLEIWLGLILIFPANLFILYGLEGVITIQYNAIQSIAIQFRTVQLLNPLMFTLNLLSGPVFCLLAGLVVRRQYQLWTSPRPTRVEEAS